MSDQAFFTRKEAADFLRVSEKTVERAINSGRLRAKRTGENGGGPYLISRAALEQWFDGLVDA